MTRPSTKSTRTSGPAEEAESLRTLLDSLTDALIVFDLEGRVLFANRRFGGLIASPAESLTGKTLTELFEQVRPLLASPEKVRSRWESLSLDPEQIVVSELDLQTDQRLHFLETSVPARRPDGALLGRLFLFRDVTREKEIDRMKTEFIAVASHELRTPMTSIKGSLDLLLGGFAGEVSGEIHELLTIAQGGCERLLRLINDILDLSKIEAGRIQLRRQPMSLFDSVQRSARTIKAYADSYKVGVEIDCPEPLPDVLADRDRIDQVVTNLLGNAIKFSPEGSTVTVALRRREDMLECAVIDHGPGIPAEQLGRIFGKFQQVEGSPRKGGTGLGLAIARALVQEHGGKIWVESQAGEGSRFVFQIPVTSPPAG